MRVKIGRSLMRISARLRARLGGSCRESLESAGFGQCVVQAACVRSSMMNVSILPRRTCSRTTYASPDRASAMVFVSDDCTRIVCWRSSDGHATASDSI